MLYVTGVFSDHEGDRNPIDKTCNSLYNAPCDNEKEGEQYKYEESAPNGIPPDKK